MRNCDLLPARIMYGSDWMLLGREPGNDGYFKAMRAQFASLFNGDAVALENFLGKNAKTYLGLDSGEPTRQRIDAYYRRSDRRVPNFAG